MRDIQEHSSGYMVVETIIMFQGSNAFWFGEFGYGSWEYYSNSNINSIMLSPLKINADFNPLNQWS